MSWVTLAHYCFHHTIDIFIMLLFPVASIIFTALFLHNDILSVSDADLDTRFIMLEVEVLEDPEDAGEADTTEMASINMEDEHKPHRVRVIF